MSLYTRIIKHEGSVKDPKTGMHIPYQDSKGFWTIGYGTLIDSRRGGGLYDEEAAYILRNRIGLGFHEANENFYWFRKLSTNRQEVIVEMLFNLGLKGLKGFKRMISAIKVEDWEDAAKEMLDSNWADDVGVRANELAEIMRTG